MSALAPDGPRCLAAFPQTFELTLVAQRVAGLPEALMLIGRKLAVEGKIAERLEVPRSRIAGDVVDHLRLENKEAAVDRTNLVRRLFFEARDLSVVRDIQNAESARWL